MRGFISDGANSAYLAPLQGHVISEALGINQSGIVVGMSNGSPTPQAMYWSDGIPTPILLPIGPTSIAEDINDRNQICGWMGIDPYPTFGASPFIWHNGKTTTLPLPDYAAADSGTATAISNRGDACGYFFVTHPDRDFVRRACAWIDGECIDLGVLPGYAESHALDINDAREIVGYCTEGGPIMAFIWRDGVMTRLGDLVPPGILTPQIAAAINNSGQIAGGAILPPPANDNVAFRLTPALPATPGDTDCSGSVNIDDLLTVIGHWNPPGPVGGDPADVNRDNRIDIEDLLQVLRHWTF